MAKPAAKPARPAAKPSKPARPAAKRSATRSPRLARATIERAADVHTRLATMLPEPPCELDFSNAWQLLVATILSAQSTDKMVNKVTPALFARWPTPAALAAADQEDVEVVVKATGFFRNKAKSIRGTAARVVEQFGGEVPRTVAELTSLPGVARKTANVVLGTAYRIASGVTVDTHAGRVARRLELTEHDAPEKVEADLMRLFPEDAWIDTGHRFVLHGRYICLARKPRCPACPLAEICPSRESDVPTTSWLDRATTERKTILTRGVPEP